MIITTILIFIVILGLLVFVHEAGHFLVAKRSGMKVDEFGFGFPPRLIGVQKVHGKWRFLWGRKQVPSPDATVYSINWIILGGFVRIVGENNEEEHNPQSFINKPFFPRLLVLVAGVAMNVILAWILISVGYIHGFPLITDDTSATHGARLEQTRVAIVDVEPSSPADKAGLQPYDIVESIDGKHFTTITDFQKYIADHKGQVFQFDVQRAADEKHIAVASNPTPAPGSASVGIGLSTFGLLHYPWYAAFWEGAKTTVYQLGAIVTGLYHVFSSGQGLKSLGGPVKIAQYTGQEAKLGFMYLVQFTAFLSLNLAILNIIPFPALDGGRVLFLFIEKIRGKRNNQTIEQIANTAGFAFLLLLMLFVTIKDLSGLEFIQHLIK